MLAHQVVQGVHSTPVSDTQVLVSAGQEPGEEVLRDQDQILSQDHAHRLPVIWIMNIKTRGCQWIKNIKTRGSQCSGSRTLKLEDLSTLDQEYKN